jgi:hypothetical protein
MIDHVGDAQAQVATKKPSLMALTMMDLKKKQIQKQNETERLLHDLEMRAQIITTNKSNTSTSTTTTPAAKTLKSFRSLVRLQEPNKLRHYKPEHKPMTYTQQLKQYQETTVVPESSRTSLNEMHKVYGSRRLPHSASSSLRTTPRAGTADSKRKIKTYAERLQELKPAHSQAKIEALNAIQNRNKAWVN